MSKPEYNRANWRMIDRQTTMDIAHRCSSGVTFTGSSKTAIIEGIMSPNGYSSNPDKFIRIMNNAAVWLPRLKREYQRKVYIWLENLDNNNENY